MTIMKKVVLSALFAAALTGANAAHADQFHWVGDVSSAFATSGNWYNDTTSTDNAGPPGSSDTAIILANGIAPQISTNVTVGVLTLTSGSLTVNNGGGSLTIQSASTVTGILRVDGTLVLSANFSINNGGRVEMNSALTNDNVFAINSGGRLEMGSGADLGGVGTLDNAGELRVTSGTCDIDPSLIGTSSGTWSVYGNATMQFTADTSTPFSGPFHINSASSFIDISSLSVSTSGTYTIYAGGNRCAQISKTTGTFSWDTGSCP